MLKSLLAASAASLLLAACVPPQAIVTDFNGDSVKVQNTQFAKEEEAKAANQVEADRICATRGKRAEYASTRQLPDYYSESLYLCI